MKSTQKNRLHVITVIFTASILMLGLTKAAQAAMATYRLEGVIEQSIEPLLIVGAPYSATLSFDPLNLTSSPDFFGGISYSSASFSFSSGAVNLSGDSISITVENNTPAGNDVIRIDGALTGSFFPNLRINLVNDDETLFNSNAFPNPFPTLADFDLGQLLINTSTTNFASLDVFEPVPTPARADISQVEATIFCPNSSSEGASLDVDVTFTAGFSAIDLTGKRVMVALSNNPSSSLTRIRTYGPFARTIPNDVTIISGDVSLAPSESVVIKVNVILAVPRGSRGTVSHVVAFLVDETGKVGTSSACVVPIQ